VVNRIQYSKALFVFKCYFQQYFSSTKWWVFIELETHSVCWVNQKTQTFISNKNVDIKFTVHDTTRFWNNPYPNCQSNILYISACFLVHVYHHNITEILSKVVLNTNKALEYCILPVVYLSTPINTQCILLIQ
jgi:hypothetical protein